MKNTLFFAAAAVLLPAVLLAPAQAQTQTFAQYSVVNTTGQNVYTFTNTGPTSMLVTFATPVTFVYNIPNGYGPAGTNIAATLNLTEMVSATATSTPIPGSGGMAYLYQPLSLSSLTLTANTPVGGQANLLTVYNSNGNVSGFSGGSIATDGGDTATGNTVNFSSSFVTFPGTDRSYNLSLTSVTPFLALSGGYLRSFTANGNGSFAFTPAPEPSGVMTLLVMGGGLALCAARRRRASC